MMKNFRCPPSYNLKTYHLLHLNDRIVVRALNMIVLGGKKIAITTNNSGALNTLRAYDEA